MHRNSEYPPSSLKLYKPHVLPIVNQEQKGPSSSSPGALQASYTTLFSNFLNSKKYLVVLTQCSVQKLFQNGFIAVPAVRNLHLITNDDIFKAKLYLLISAARLFGFNSSFHLSSPPKVFLDGNQILSHST